MKPGIGAVLDGYKLLSEVASGSCGTVFQAENIISGERVALKIFPEQGSFAEHELQAVRLFRKIEHPNLIRIHHVGQNGSMLFYTMDWCESSLAQRKVSPEELLEIARKLTGALAALHGHGLIHRDIKPANLLFRDGEIVLGDIGLVTRQENATPAGTRGFMPPVRQNKIAVPDVYSDCYALAKSLYCALSGQGPGKFPCYEGTLSSAASLLMCAIMAVCSDPPEIHDTAEFLHLLNESDSNSSRRKKIRLWRIILPVISGLFLFSAAGFFFLRHSFRKETAPSRETLPPTQKTIQVQPRETNEFVMMQQEIEWLRKSAGQCKDPEKKFELERKICFAELLADLLKRRNAGMLSYFEFRQEQENLIRTSNFIQRFRFTGTEKMIYPERDLEAADPELEKKLEITDPKLKKTWNDANKKWQTQKNSYALKILRKIRESRRKPEDILREMAGKDPALQFYGLDQLEFLDRYKNAKFSGRTDAKKECDEAIAKYLQCRKAFLQAISKE